MWPSKQHVVKVGGRGLREVPASMVANYVDRYPSQLPGGALEGTLPPGPDPTPAKAPAKPDYDANDPHPDIDRYDPSKVKLPDKDAGTTTDTTSAKANGDDDPSGDAARPAKTSAEARPAQPKASDSAPPAKRPLSRSPNDRGAESQRPTRTPMVVVAIAGIVESSPSGSKTRVLSQR